MKRQAAAKRKTRAAEAPAAPGAQAPAQAPVQAVERSFRKSTVAVTETSAADRAEKKQKAETQATKRRALNANKEPVAKLTQEQLLAEAARTELLNQRSLQLLLHIEEDKKRVRNKKKQDSGPMIRYYSKNGRSTITFCEPLGIPPVMNQRGDKYPGPKRCAVTGLPAKYIDPVTGHYYANADAFKKLRMQCEQQH